MHQLINCKGVGLNHVVVFPQHLPLSVSCFFHLLLEWLWELYLRGSVLCATDRCFAMRFPASRVFRDQSDLRLVTQKERRTDVLIHLWGERNGTVGELLSLLKELQLLRACDIILSCESRKTPGGGAGLGWAGLGWAGLGWAGLGWAVRCINPLRSRVFFFLFFFLYFDIF